MGFEYYQTTHVNLRVPFSEGLSSAVTIDKERFIGIDSWMVLKIDEMSLFQVIKPSGISRSEFYVVRIALSKFSCVFPKGVKSCLDEFSDAPSLNKLGFNIVKPAR